MRASEALFALTSLSLLATPASAQVVTGEAEFGVRQLFGERESAKFLEYRSIPDGLFLSRVDLSVDWGASDHLLTLSVRDALEGDESVRVRLGRTGRYQLAVDYDRIPHLFTNSGTSLLYVHDTPGVYALPDRVKADLERLYSTDIDLNQAGVQRDIPALAALINDVVRPVDVSLERESGRVTLEYTPSPGWDARASYSLENERGARPLGATFSFNTQEQLEPIDHTTQEVSVDIERASARWSLGGGYLGSFFRNHVDAMVWDNPFSVRDLPTAGSRGRLDLYPDNLMHQGRVTAAAAVPWRGRWTLSAAAAVMSQDDPFLPFTINSAIPNVPALPARSANAKVGTTQLSSTLVLRPIERVDLRLRYRYYDRENDTPVFTFMDYVRTDDRLAGVSRTNRPYAYSQRNAGVEATWQLPANASLKVGYERESWDREYRETKSTIEDAFSGMVNLNHGGWLFLRGSLRKSDRRGDEYDPVRVGNEGFPHGEVGGQLEALRKFDQADRSRTRGELIARVGGGAPWTVSMSHSWLDDDYPESTYGLQESASRIAAIDLDVSPREGVTLSADYARGTNRTAMRSRQRTSTNDSPENDWISETKEPLTSYGAALVGELARPGIELDVRYHRSEGKGLTRTWTPGAPDLVTTAEDYPEVINDRQLTEATLRYQITDRTTVQVQYSFERYDQADFAMDPMAAFMGFVDPASAGTTWIGATRPDYRAHILGLSLITRF